MKFKLSIVLLISLLMFFGTSGNADEEFSTGTVTVYDNVPETFVDLDLQSLDHINESTKTPLESEIILITAQINFVDNTSSEVTVTLFYSIDTSNYWNEIIFVYNSTTDMYFGYLGGYSKNTLIQYYATSYDGLNTVRTPATGYTSITWLDEIEVVQQTGTHRGDAFGDELWGQLEPFIFLSVSFFILLILGLLLYRLFNQAAGTKGGRR